MYILPSPPLQPVEQEDEEQQHIEHIQIDTDTASTTTMQDILPSPSYDKDKSVLGFPELEIENSSLRFLLVDDNPLNLALFSKMLSKLFSSSTTIHTTTDPIHAISLVRSNSYHILFVDIEMPIMNGVELSSFLRQVEGYDKLCIIAVTSCSSQQDISLHHQIGMDLTIPKPLRYTELQNLRSVIVQRLRNRMALPQP